MADAVFNVAHSSLLVLGLAQSRLDLVARGLADRLHQPRRASLYPESMALVARAPSSARSAPRSPAPADGAGLEPVRRDRRRGRAAAGRDDGLGRRHAGPVRAAGGGCAGVDVGAPWPGRPHEHRRPQRHRPHQPPHVPRPPAHAPERRGLADRLERGRRVDRQPVAARPAREQLRLVAREGEGAAAVGGGRVVGVELVGDREAAGRRLRAGAADRDRERAHRSRPSRRRVSRRAERSTWIERSVAPRRARAAGIQPRRPFGPLARQHAQPAAAPRDHAQHALRAELGPRAQPVQRAAARRVAQLVGATTRAVR